MSIRATAYVLLAAAVCLPETGWAQNEGDCVFCMNVRHRDDRSSVGHFAWDNGHWGQANSRGDGTHPGTWWPGACEDRHPLCGRTRTGGQGLASSEVAAKRIWEAVRRGDGSKAVELALAQPEGSPIYVLGGGQRFRCVDAATE